MKPPKTMDKCEKITTIMSDFDRAIITIAEDFYEAYCRCNEHKNTHVDEWNRIVSEIVGVPAIVNASFAIELYLKSISDNWGHSIKELFEALSDRDQAGIRAEVEKHLVGSDTFSEGLDVIDNAFAFWRYIHEKPDFGFGYNKTMMVLPAFLEGIREYAKERWESRHKEE